MHLSLLHRGLGLAARARLAPPPASPRVAARAASLLALLACAASPAGAQISLPVTFEADIDYELVDFGGAMSSLVADPTDPDDQVVQTVRPLSAECFAGTTVADVSGFTERIPFTPDATTMSVRVWSPEAGIRVLFKVEEVGNPGLNVETFTFTTVAGAWETMVFDLGDPMPNLNPLQFGANYNKASIFFDFQCNLPGAPAAERTYLWDDVTFGETPPVSSEDGAATDAARLAQNAPNPFRGQTTIRFSLARAETVQIQVYDVLGQRVATLVDGPLAAGDHAVTLDGARLASGTYVYRLSHGGEVATRSMVVIR